MNRREDAKSFIWAALVLMAEGLVVRLLLGASPVRELLQFVGAVAAAFVAVIFFRCIPHKRMPKVEGRFWGILGYAVILGLGVLTMLLILFPSAGVVPAIGAVLPTLALLPLLRYTEGRGTPGFVLTLAGVIGAAAVTWVLGFAAASVITGLVGAVVLLCRRQRFGEGDARWIGHLIFAGLVFAGICLVFISEINRPWLGEWIKATFSPDASSFGEAFGNYITRTLWTSSRLFGTSTLEEILVWTSPQQYMAVEELLPGADSYLVLATVAYRWGLAPFFAILVSMVMVPVCGCYLARSQRGFQCGITLTISLLLGLPILFFICQSVGCSVLIIDFCPFFSGGFIQNFVYLLLVFAAIHHISPLTADDKYAQVTPAGRKRAMPHFSRCRLIHCSGGHEEIAVLKKCFLQEHWPTEKVEAAFAAADTFTLFSAEGRYHDVRLAARELSLECPQATLLALLVEYTEAVPCQDEAKDMKDLVWANFAGEKCPRMHVTCGHIGDICDEPMGTWRIVVAMGTGAFLPKAGEAQVDAASMVS